MKGSFREVYFLNIQTDNPDKSRYLAKIPIDGRYNDITEDLVFDFKNYLVAEKILKSFRDRYI